MDTNAEGQKSGAEEFFDPDMAETISPDFFIQASWENYFSTVRLIDDYLPLGSGKPMCLHLEWIKKE